MTPKSKQWLLFLLGLGAVTEIHVIGSIGISELFCYAFAPFVFWAHRPLFARLHMGMFFGLLALWGAFAVTSDWLNGIYPIVERWKTWAPIYSLFAVSVCASVLLADDIWRFRWFLVGAFISAVIASFVFTPAAVAEMASSNSTGASMNTAFGYKAWYYGTLGAMIWLPVQLWYLSFPTWVSLSLAGGGAVLQLFLGGRASFLIGGMSLILLWFGRSVRSVVYHRPRRFSFLGLSIAVLCMGLLVKGVYKTAVTSGWMGDEEQQKYEAQSKMGTSALALLMSGRGETFCGIFAALDKPFIGHGSKAWDTRGYYTEYVEKYGDDQDVRTLQALSLRGMWPIPGHSHIVAAWLWHGVGGLIFWMYVLWLLYKTVSEWMWYAPPIVGWLALVLPGLLWNIAFSPLSGRTTLAVMFTCVLLVRDIAKNTKKRDAFTCR